MTTSIVAKRPRRPQARKFYHVGLGRYDTAPGLQVENIPLINGHRVLMSPPGGRSFPPLSEPLRVLIDRSLGRAPGDWELFDDFRLVSERMKRLLETVDREGVAFLKCETRSLGRRPAPDCWLCDVIREIDAIDEEKSQGAMMNVGTERRRYAPTGRPRFVFKEEVVGSAHIFRPRLWGFIICDQVMKDACREVGVKGISFRDAAGE